MGHSSSVRYAQVFGGLTHMVDNIRVGDCGELEWQVRATRSLVPDSAGHHGDVASLRVGLHAARCADSDEGVRPYLDQLLNGDGGGRASDASTRDTHLFAQKCACVRRELAILRDELRVIEEGSNLLASAWITWCTIKACAIRVSDGEHACTGCSGAHQAEGRSVQRHPP